MTMTAPGPMGRRTAPTLLLLLALGACGADHTEGVSTATVADPVAPPTTPPPTATGRETLTIAREGSEVGFTGAKVTGSHSGTFSDFGGTITLAPEITDSTVSVTIQIGSLVIEPQRLHDHLLSDELFGATTFPTATFESTSIVAGGTGNVGDVPATHTVTGNLTLHGQSHAITFPAVIAVSPAEVTASAEFVIDRRDFGIVYPGMPDDLIQNDVVIRFRVRAPRS
jgi:polyisoprenoid-binding protein YceI